MAYLRAGSFTQSNDDPCSPASHCFSSHRCNYCSEALLAKSPHSKEEDHNSPLLLLPAVLKPKIPLRTTLHFCRSVNLIGSSVLYGYRRCCVHRLAWCIHYCWHWCAFSPHQWEMRCKRGHFLFLSRWCVIVWATVEGGWEWGGVYLCYSLHNPSDKDFNSP